MHRTNYQPSRTQWSYFLFFIQYFLSGGERVRLELSQCPLQTDIDRNTTIKGLAYDPLFRTILMAVHSVLQFIYRKRIEISHTVLLITIILIVSTMSSAQNFRQRDLSRFYILDVVTILYVNARWSVYACLLFNFRPGWPLSTNLVDKCRWLNYSGGRCECSNFSCLSLCFDIFFFLYFFVRERRIYFQFFGFHQKVNIISLHLIFMKTNQILPFLQQLRASPTALRPGVRKIYKEKKMEHTCKIQLTFLNESL